MIRNPVVEKEKTIIIERTLKLPLYTIWKAWSEPESFKKWWGPKGYTCPSCMIDFTVGGRNLSCMKAEDGKEFWSTGTYLEIDPQKKIVYTDSFSDNKGNIIPASEYDMPGDWPLELKVTVELKEDGNNTKMKLTHAGIPLEMQDDCVNGWQESFDKMENNLK